jgi:hypothetical protein
VTDALATAVAAKPVVTGLGGAWMISSEAKVAGTEHGYRGWQLYLAGRAGVLGDVSAEVVHATLGFLHPDLVRSGWLAGREVAPLGDTVVRYVGVCRSWGRRRYAGLAEADRLAGMLHRVVDAADPAGWPLFAAWRAEPLPDDGPGRVVQLLHVLREHRGGAHLAAVRHAGLTPLEAIVAGSGGAANATFFGWPEPFPEPTDELRTRLAAADAATDAQVAPAYAVLSAEERAELPRLLGAAAKSARRAARAEGPQAARC